MTQDEIISMALEAGFGQPYIGAMKYELKRFAALVAAHAKSDQINTAYQQGCEDMKRRMEKRMQQLDSQLQLCQTAVANEREACAKVCDDIGDSDNGYGCAAAIRERSNANARARSKK